MAIFAGRLGERRTESRSAMHRQSICTIPPPTGNGSRPSRLLRGGWNSDTLGAGRKGTTPSPANRQWFEVRALRSVHPTQGSAIEVDEIGE